MICSQIMNAKYKTKRRLLSLRQAPRGIYWETPTLAHLKRRTQVHYYRNSVYNNRADGTMRSRGDPAAFNTDRLSPRQRCPLQWYSQPIVCPVCGQNLAFLVYTVMRIECCRFRYLQYFRVRSRQQGPPRHTLTTHGRYTKECSSNSSSSGNSSGIGGVSQSVAVP